MSVFISESTANLYTLYAYVCMYRYPSENSGKTPLLCAAEAGHDEIVAYLLQFREVQTALKSQPPKVSSASVSYSYINLASFSGLPSFCSSVLVQYIT